MVDIRYLDETTIVTGSSELRLVIARMGMPNDKDPIMLDIPNEGHEWFSLMQSLVNTELKEGIQAVVHVMILLMFSHHDHNWSGYWIRMQETGDCDCKH
jgi:hypothetical protein